MNDPILGILGGMGPQASDTFYEMLIRGVEAHRDQDHLRVLLWSDSSIPDRTAGILSGEEEPVYQALYSGVKLLEQAGCAAVAITCNTAHHFADRLQEQLSIPILHMVRLTAQEAKARGVEKVGMLATDGTVQTGLYQKELAALGLETAVPPPPLQKRVMSLIYDEVKSGLPGSWTTFGPVDAWLRENGCGCAILGCTELSVFRENHPLPPYYIDAMEVLACQAIRFCGKPLKKGS